MKTVSKPFASCVKIARDVVAGHCRSIVDVSSLCLTSIVVLFLTGCPSIAPLSPLSPKVPSYGEEGLQCCDPVFYRDEVNDAFVTRGWYAVAAVNKVEIVVPDLDPTTCKEAKSLNRYLPIAHNWRGTGVEGLTNDNWGNVPDYKHVRLFLNANFFRVDPYTKCGQAYGWTVSNGKTISTGRDDGNGLFPDALVFWKDDKEGPVSILTYNETEKAIQMESVANAVSGYRLLKDGKYVPQPTNLDEKASLPRTAVGFREDRDHGLLLYMVSVNPGNNGEKDKIGTGGSGGTSLQALANYFLQLGVTEAINLDGGGSSQFLAKLPPTDGRLWREFTSFPSDCRMQQRVDSGKIVGEACNSKFDYNDGIVPQKSSVYRPLPIFLGIGPPRKVRD